MVDACRHRMFIEFSLVEGKFWRADLFIYRRTYASLCAPRMIFDFHRTSVAFYMFLIIDNTVFRHQKLMISTTFTFPPNLLSVSPKDHPKRSPNASPNHRRRSAKAHETGIGNHAHKNSTFCARSFRGIPSLRAPDPIFTLYLKKFEPHPHDWPYSHARRVPKRQLFLVQAWEEPTYTPKSWPTPSQGRQQRQAMACAYQIPFTVFGWIWRPKDDLATAIHPRSKNAWRSTAFELCDMIQMCISTAWSLDMAHRSPANQHPQSQALTRAWSIKLSTHGFRQVGTTWQAQSDTLSHACWYWYAKNFMHACSYTIPICWDKHGSF